MKRALALAAALAMLGGCAIQPPPAPPTARTPPPAATPQAPPTTTAPSPGAQIGTTASGGTIRVNATSHPATATSPAVVDSTPSAEGLAVLNSIPEPLARSGTVPGAAETASARPASTPEAVPPAAGATPTDTARSAPIESAGTSPTDSVTALPADTVGVPVPSPTEPLGDRPGSLASKALPDSLAVSSGAALAAGSVAAPNSRSAAGSGSRSAGPGAAPATASGAVPTAAPSAGSATAPAAAPVSPDSCWRVQVAAPPERERADRLADAARSQLAIGFVVEREGGLYKVRTRDCLTAVAADGLRRRAVATGFEGAFRFQRKRR